MQDSIRSFLLELLEKKTKLPANFDDTTDYIEAGIIDSIGIIKFILEIESRFDIEMTDEEIESDAFRSVQGLVTMVSSKVTGRD